MTGTSRMRGSLLWALAVGAAGLAVGVASRHFPAPSKMSLAEPSGWSAQVQDGPSLPSRGVQVSPAGARQPGRRALLVGVTRYDNLPQRVHLQGPANDVRLLRTTLVERHGFAPEAVVSLTEEEGTPELRPTRANIAREFKRLADVASAGEQIVVLLAGHGYRQPEAIPPGPNPEPDGIDEIFLPADVGVWKGYPERVPNAIVDDEIGEWLRAISRKQAYVWAIFDCCHSGTMTRGSEVIREVERGILVPEEALEDAKKRAADRAESRSTGHMRFIRQEPDTYLVASYASRPTEATPESPQPCTDQNAKYHGLLTYTVCEILTQATAPLTYRELTQRVQLHYTRRPQGSPTPTVEGGGQEREVLGLRRWPGRSDVLLHKSSGRYRVNAGELHGVTRGSILAVNGPAGSPTVGTRLGHVRVTGVTPTEAFVEPVAHDDLPLVADLPDLAGCKVVFMDYGVGRFRLAVDVSPGPDRDRILATVDRLTDPKTGAIELVTDPRRADWLIRVRDGSPELLEAAATRPPFVLAAAGDREFQAQLVDRLEKLFRARNLLAVSARADAEAARGGAAVRLEVDVLRHKARGAPEEPARPVQGDVGLRAGEWVSYRVRNAGPLRVDVTMLIVGTDYKIDLFFPKPSEVGKATLEPGGSLITPQGQVGEPFGPEQMVVLAVPAANPPVDFGILAQPGLEIRRGGVRPKALDTPLGRLMECSMFRVGGARGVSRGVEEREMGVRLVSWRTDP